MQIAAMVSLSPNVRPSTRGRLTKTVVSIASISNNKFIVSAVESSTYTVSKSLVVETSIKFESAKVSAFSGKLTSLIASLMLINSGGPLGGTITLTL